MNDAEFIEQHLSRGAEFTVTERRIISLFITLLDPVDIRVMGGTIDEKRAALSLACVFDRENDE